MQIAKMAPILNFHKKERIKKKKTFTERILYLLLIIYPEPEVLSLNDIWNPLWLYLNGRQELTGVKRREEQWKSLFPKLWEID